MAFLLSVIISGTYNSTDNLIQLLNNFSIMEYMVGVVKEIEEHNSTLYNYLIPDILDEIIRVI